jgi:hypothetical protein
VATARGRRCVLANGRSSASAPTHSLGHKPSFAGDYSAASSDCCEVRSTSSRPIRKPVGEGLAYSARLGQTTVKTVLPLDEVAETDAWCARAMALTM